MAKYGKAASKSVERANAPGKRGTLRSGKGGKGGKVTSRKQAIANWAFRKPERRARKFLRRNERSGRNQIHLSRSRLRCLTWQLRFHSISKLPGRNNPYAQNTFNPVWPQQKK